MPGHPSTLRIVPVGRQRMRVAVRPGSGPNHAPEQPPLLLCNGIGASLDLLDPFVDALDPALEVIRFDPPGVGGSPTPRLPYPFPALAALVGRLLDTLGHRHFNVLGISWGGGLAQQLAVQNPRRCRRVVLVSTATGMLMVPARPRVLARLATPRRYWDARYAQSVAGQIYGGQLRDQPELVQRLVLDYERRLSGRGYLYQLAAGAGWTSLPFLPLIRQPTLIMAGSDDPIIPLVNARLMAHLLPHGQLHVYPDGHLGLLTMADELAAVIGDFLTPAADLAAP
jgi:poly(3-hydroxyalkanoate) depolymerase